MKGPQSVNWQEKVIPVKEVLKKIKPGMSIYLSTGPAEPRGFIKALNKSKLKNLYDLELIQVFGIEAFSAQEIYSKKYRLKTCISGVLTSEAIDSGKVDLIPVFLFQIPYLIGSGQMNIDVAVIQITKPNAAGYCNFGIAMDAARQAMHQAKLVIGEINESMPFTYGDTFVPISEFDYLIESEEPIIHFGFNPSEHRPVFYEIADNIASVIEDGSCLSLSFGPIDDALCLSLSNKQHLGIQSPLFTDALMRLCKSGAVSNRNKKIFTGKSLVSYAIGSKALYEWLANNPMVEFQSIEQVFNPLSMGRNAKFMGVIHCRKVDLSGRIALFPGRINFGGTLGEVVNMVTGCRISQGGMSIFALPSRNEKNECNILLSVEAFEEPFTIREAVDLVVTEFGVANLYGRTLRERAQALIEVAHPEDRKRLLETAKENNILYKDQIFIDQSAHLYPKEIETTKTFKNDVKVRFRAIKPSDEDQMRRLFYRFSDKAVYYRYFTHLKAMPHASMQRYVNVDYGQVMSIVGLVGPPDKGRLIAEGRYAKSPDRLYAEVAFVVDESYQGYGIATFMYRYLVKLAKERGLQGFRADVLASNRAMMKVFEKEGRIDATLDQGIYKLIIRFDR